MDMKDIFQQIENVFAKHKLIGNKDFSEDEYAFMVDYVGTVLFLGKTTPFACCILQ
jgi:hypothetical protein